MNKKNEIEKLLGGYWQNIENYFVWDFRYHENAPKKLIISDTNQPVGGMLMDYEVTYISDEEMFLDLIWRGVRKQHQFWFLKENQSSIKVHYPTKDNAGNVLDEYSILNKV